MIESTHITFKQPLLDNIRSINKEVLYDFAIKYLVNHVYINGKKLAIYYICEECDLTPIKSDYNTIKCILTHKFSFVVSKLVVEGKTVKYSSHLYKRVELPLLDYISIVGEIFNILGPDK